MASLFKNRTLKEKLEGFDIPHLDAKLEIIKKWHDAYKNGLLKEKTETQCEQAFNNDFFEKVLGYKSLPHSPYTIQPKDNVDIGGGQLPDATLGYFSPNDRRIVAVVEIKDVNTPLDKPQQRQGHLTPVQQAFKYKPLYRECSFVIATNFFEIRLFRDNQLDYEQFTLTQLLNPADDYFEFRKFYYLLCETNFTVDKGETETEKLLSAIRVQQEDITNKFYKEYKKLREDLIRDILKNNHITRDSLYVLAVEKAQKIVDRIVLISFFEDCGLLPENKLREVVEYAEKGSLETPVWDVMKQFFTAIDEGSGRLGIPNGYNGELFKEDDKLNELKISNSVCKRFVDFCKYDFKEDLSVNILGHIFEQSISDLERLRDYSEGIESNQENKSSRRKREGIFYTPGYVVDYIIRNSLGKHLEEKEYLILSKYGIEDGRSTEKTYAKKLERAFLDYQDHLRSIKVLDPACGSGAFLVGAFDYLLEENKRVAQVLGDIRGGSKSIFDTENYIKKVLQNNIFGVDLNAESVEITKLSLWLKTAQKGEKLITLKNNIKCGNSLVEDSNIAGKKAFKWDLEFKDILLSGGFDVIIGNPPYVFGGNAGISKDEKEYYKKKYKSGTGKINLFTLFIEKAYYLLKESGSFSYIIPNTFLRVTSYANSRKFFLENFLAYEIADLGDGIFEDAVTTAIILSAKKQIPTPDTVTRIIKDFSGDFTEVYQKDFVRAGYIIATNTSPHSNALIQKIISHSVPLGTLTKEMIFGVVITKNKDQVVSEQQFPGYKPFLEGKDIGAYYIKPVHQYLNYDPKLLHRSRSREVFEVNEKILVQRISGGKKPLKAAYDNKGLYNKESINNIILNEECGYNIKFILGLLNSDLINWFYNNQFTNESKLTVNISKEYMSRIPIVKCSDQKPLIVKVESMIDLTSRYFEAIKKANILLKSEISNNHPINSEISFESNFDDFLRKSKVELPLSKKSEIFDFYENSKASILSLKKEQAELNFEINELVYDLYGLSIEERKLLS
jgi:type I restriction-modification system DNA methylase subunit